MTVPRFSRICRKNGLLLTHFIIRLFVNTPAIHIIVFILGKEEKTNVELIVPIGSVVIAMFFWLLIVFVIRGKKRVRTSSSSLCHTFPSLDFPCSYTEIQLKHTHTSTYTSTYTSTHTVGVSD